MKRVVALLFLLASGFCVHDLCAWNFFKSPSISDVGQSWSMRISSVKKPESKDELKKLLVESTKPIAIAGGRYSQGGQIAYPDALVIDTTGLNKIVNLDTKEKTITVEAGITWRAIQEYIDPHNLSVSVMQSYDDFTVGGSLSVNVHGRMVTGPLISSVLSIEVMLADGTVVFADRNTNKELFDAVIGGYGLLGVVTQVTLQLTDNYKMERRIVRMPYSVYSDYFFKYLLTDTTLAFENAVLYPNKYNVVDIVTWHQTDAPLTVKDRLQERREYYPLQMVGEILLRRIAPLKDTRSLLEGKLIGESFVVWRNYEMSHTVRTLEPITRKITTSVLQEYFIPVDKLDEFIGLFRDLAQKYKINVLNASIRYVPADKESLLSYAPQDSFAIVLYLNTFNTKDALVYMKKWTQKLIDAAYECGGRYYLPYHIYASKKQFNRVYPEFQELLRLKKQYDPTNKFKNMLFAAYG